MKATTKMIGHQDHLLKEGSGIIAKDFVWAKVKGHNWWPAEVIVF